jgi:hypothetical protein
MSKRYIVKASRINSLAELQMEKERVKMEIMRKETEIHSDFRNIVQALTFRNIVSNLADNITVQSAVLSKAITFGKALFSKRKKKKKE